MGPIRGSRNYYCECQWNENNLCCTSWYR